MKYLKYILAFVGVSLPILVHLGDWDLLPFFVPTYFLENLFTTFQSYGNGPQNYLFYIVIFGLLNGLIYFALGRCIETKRWILAFLLFMLFFPAYYLYLEGTCLC